MYTTGTTVHINLYQSKLLNHSYLLVIYLLHCPFSEKPATTAHFADLAPLDWRLPT
jgi:hypothetical protein